MFAYHYLFNFVDTVLVTEQYHTFDRLETCSMSIYVYICILYIYIHNLDLPCVPEIVRLDVETTILQTTLQNFIAFVVLLYLLIALLYLYIP